MSFEYYINWWVQSKKNLEYLVGKDEATKAKTKPVDNRHLANNLIGGLYAKYAMVVQDLCECVDQLAQPQKRVAVKKLVDAACIRLNEFNDQLRQISISEYHAIDGSLVELKLVPYDVEILHPCLFHHRPVDVEEMIEKINRGEKIFKLPEPTIVMEDSSLNVLQSASVTVQPVTSVHILPQPQTEEPRKRKQKLGTLISLNVGPENTLEEMTIKARQAQTTDAVVMIQTAERARQERVYFFQKNLQHQRAKALREAEKTEMKAPPAEVAEKAAQVIERVWKGFLVRDEMQFRENKRRMLIGMHEPSYRSKAEFEILDANIEKRRKVVDARLRDYINAQDQERARVFRVVAPGLLEDIEAEIREWFHTWYVEAKTFDKYPPEEKGGTILVVRGLTMTPKEYLDEYERKRREKVKAGGADALQAKKEREKKAQVEAEKKKKEAEARLKAVEAAKKKQKKKKAGDFEMEYPDTLTRPMRKAADDEFAQIWDERDELLNPEEKHYMDLITDKFLYENQLSVRQKADELMRMELELLNEALAKDKHKKYKKPKQKRKKKKGKKGKKDITADRPTEDLFQELVDNGIITTYTKTTLDQFTGDFSFNNTELRELDFDPSATILDVRQAVTLNCILPLGVETMKKPRSVLIAGPRQIGKHLLAKAVFWHTRCVLFDLSPKNTTSVYPGAKGLAMLIHLVSKMSRVLQPSVIYFDDAEKVFYKKVPKEERDLDPKRVGKKLVKGIIKAIKPDDRVLVLGITGAPWLAQAAKLKKAFERVILIPRPDYGSVYLWWRELLRPYHGVDRDFNFTSLATMTKYQPYSEIKNVVEKVMTPRRIIQLKYNPLKQQELFEVFISNAIEPISDKEWKKFLKWYKKTPLGRERAVFNKWADGKRALEKKQQEKQKGKK